MIYIGYEYEFWHHITVNYLFSYFILLPILARLLSSIDLKRLFQLIGDNRVA